LRAGEIAALRAQEESHWWFRARRRILAALLEPLLRQQPPLRVVDLGCGAGVDLERLPLGSALRVGVEPAALAGSSVAAAAGAASGRPARASAAPARVPSAREPADGAARVWFVRGRAEATPLLEGKFDLALALDVLEHLDDDAAALAEAVRLLRPAGRLLVTVPAGPALWSEHDEALGHRRRYRRADLRRLVESARLEIERLTHFNSLLFLPAAAYRRARRLALRMRPGGGQGRGDPARAGDGAAAEGARVPVSDTRRLGNAGGGLLEAIFAAERWWLRGADFPFGLSLLCLARRAGAGGGLTQPPVPGCRAGPRR
jgi:SAM-dependent methyltransferase